MSNSPTTRKPRKEATSSRDAELTRARILDAAEDEFAKAGLLGARTEAIAANTKVTKAMIYYYFEDKEKLYQSVLERAFARRVSAVQKLDLLGTSPEQALRLMVESFLNEVSQHPNLSAILFYEAMQNNGRFYKDIAIATLYEPLEAIITRGITAGVFRNVDPRHASVNIMGACVFYFCARENVKHLWEPGTNLMSPEMVTTHVSEAVDFVLAGLRK
jgi:TetR/AcrR family transcriptional regulator